MQRPYSSCTDWANDGTNTNDYPNDITKYTSQYVNRYTYDAVGNTISDAVSGQDNIIWNHYNKVSSDFNAGQNQQLFFDYDGAGNRYLKTVSKANGDTTLKTSDYYVRDAQGNILAIYKDEGSYGMAQQQWIEYLTYSFVRYPCNWLDYLRKYISPFYASNANFTGSLMAYAQSNNPAWVQQKVTDSAVSYYLKDATVSWNTISWLQSTPAFWAGAAQWAKDNGRPGLISTGFLNNHVAMQQFANGCFFNNNSSEACGGLLALAKNYAPVLYNKVKRTGR